LRPPGQFRNDTAASTDARKDARMINVTDRAKEKLKELKTQKLAEVAPEAAGVGLRLDQSSPGQLGIFPDARREGDEVVEYEGSPVLYVGETIAEAVNGTTIDCDDGGQQLVIRKDS
jgi:Fe-S cluster assembly iron-binding protein IscA